MEALHTLLNKLDRFIRRYYLNQLIKGSLWFGAGLLVLFLLFATIEYFGYFSTRVRFILFYSYLLFNAVILVRYVIIPLMGMIRIGKRISPEQAAKLLGKYYPDQINDKITNVLQLKRFLDQNPENAALVMAGIDQKAAQTITLPFQKAIPLRGNLRFIPYLLVPLVFFLAFYLLQPAFLLEPARRIVQYETPFERPTPFVIEMESQSTGFRNEDLEVVVRAVGPVFPSEAFLLINNTRYRMEDRKNGRFAYTLRNLQRDTQFNVEAQGFLFGPFGIQVFEKATFNHFHIAVDNPDYTGLSDEAHTNMGDLAVIYGAEISWTFFTNPHGEIEFMLGDEILDAETIRPGEHRVQARAIDSFEYKVFAYDREHGRGDSLSYYVTVQADAYPRISVEEYRDEVLQAHLFYRGNIQDDFGFSSLDFFYRVMDQSQMNRGEDLPFMREQIEFDPHLRNQAFYHHFDLQSVYVQPGETVELYFEVYDNDPISGPKSTRSQRFTYYIPTREEILADRQQSDEQIREGLSDGAGEVRDARDQLEDLRRRLLESERMGWEERDILQDLLNKKEEMEQRLQEMGDMKRDAETRSEQFMESSDRIKKKQEELQKLFDEILSDELRDLFDQIRDELDKLDRDKVYEMLDRMDFEFQDLEMQLDRALEMYRQFAMERMLQESIDRLDDLAEQQEGLLEEAGQADDGEALSESQEGIHDAFEHVREMLEEFRKTNEMLSRPHEVEDTGSQEEAISEDLKNALDRLQMDQMMESMPHMQDAGQKMQQLSENLQQMQMDMFQKSLAEDARAIRMLLENLLRSSFAQEDLMLETRQANVNDPRFVDLIREQRKIQSDVEMIKDSLVALSKRQMAIQSYVHREIEEINLNMRQGINQMINRRRHQAASRQQFVMTHINNLALLLNESLQDIQQQMAMGGQGMGEDAQPGGSPSFQDLREMQEKMNEMLQQMRDGHQPMPGETGEPSMSMSEQMARMAAEQEAIRNKLKELADDLRGQGLEEGRGLDELQREMEQTELDILRKELSRETMLRQERILTRLLEHENAELQREREDRREGTTADRYDISNPEEFFEYNRIRERELEMLRSMPPGLRPFYRTLVEQYFLHVE